MADSQDIVNAIQDQQQTLAALGQGIQAVLQAINTLNTNFANAQQGAGGGAGSRSGQGHQRPGPKPKTLAERTKNQFERSIAIQAARTGIDPFTRIQGAAGASIEKAITTPGVDVGQEFGRTLSTERVQGVLDQTEADLETRLRRRAIAGVGTSDAQIRAERDQSLAIQRRVSDQGVRVHNIVNEIAGEERTRQLRQSQGREGLFGGARDEFEGSLRKLSDSADRARRRMDRLGGK